MYDPKQGLEVTVTRSSPQVVFVVVTGELDFGTSGRLEEQLNAAVPSRGDRLCLDLSLLGFCDVAGLRALQEIGRAFPGSEITTAGSAVDTVMHLCRLPILLGYTPSA
jgi:ABC-type transporter Mla MlaB component